MNVQKTPFRIETALGQKPSENLIEGRLSVPADKADIGRVLLVQGKVRTSAEPGDGKVFVEGSVKFFVVYIGPEGNIDSFESSSPFRHTENVENAGAGMNVYVRGSVREIDYSVEDGRTLYIKGVVSLSLSGNVAVMKDAVTALDSRDAQIKTQQMKISAVKDFKKDFAAVREDIRIPQSMPKAQKVLLSDAYASVKSVRVEDLKIIVEGDIKLMMLYLSDDGNAPLQYFNESVPFGSILPFDKASPGDKVFTEADLFDLSIEIAEGEGDILRMSANINVVCTVMSQTEFGALSDAYSLKNKLNIHRSDCSHVIPVFSGMVKAIARCAITLPEESNISRIICMKSSPVIVSTAPNTDRVYLEGIMMFTVCYSSPEGMRSYSGEAPFEAEAQMEGLMPSHQIEAYAEVEYCSCENAGRDLSVKFMMDVTIKAFETNGFSIVSDVEETEHPAPHKKGITIYFADVDEDIWDIAKRYSTTLDTVRNFNPGLGDIVHQGQKILIMG